jgi:hypothetical protein
MTETGDELVRRLHQEEIERMRQESETGSLPPREVQYPPLPDAEPGSPMAEEWTMFKREVGRLLQEGHRGKFALIKAGQAITIWDTFYDAVQAAQSLDGNGKTLVQEVLPYLRRRPFRIGA